jgi:uncharacterized protein
MNRYHTPSRSSRRTVLRSTAGLAVGAALAGCLGDGTGGATSGSANGSGSGGGTTDMVMLTSTETTTAYAMSQGIAAVVNQNSDGIRIDARPSEGTEANIGQLNQEGAQIVYIQNWTANEIQQGREPFGNLSFTPNQVFHLYDLGWFLCSSNGGWQSITDIQSGSRVSPTPRGSGTAEMIQSAIGYVTEDYQRISLDYGEQASAMSEGRLDVGAGTIVNFSTEPSWVQEMKSTVNLRMLGFPGNAAQQIESDPALILTDVPATDLSGYAYTPDPLNALTLAYNFVVRNDFDYDAVYNLLTTLYENRDGLGEYNALLNEHTDLEFWLQNAYDGMPFHPAAADFYEEQGVWNDDLTRGEGQGGSG